LSAPGERHVHVPSGRALVSSMSILRDMGFNLQRPAAPLHRLLSSLGRPVSSRVGSGSCQYAPGVRTEPVLLVHGFASSFERNWREPGWVDLLEEAGRQVIQLDLLGHGEADKPHDPSAYSGLDGSVEAALPREGAVDAIGFSL